uniref:CSON001193 protein n=1 Tax=Culicoides sonorensis TaxID=179676 RepID=A0A336MG39_CULSO
MKFFVVLAIVAYSAATSAVKVASPAYSLNVIHHPSGAHSVYNPFVKPAYPTVQFPTHGQANSFFGKISF